MSSTLQEGRISEMSEMSETNTAAGNNEIKFPAAVSLYFIGNCVPYETKMLRRILFSLFSPALRIFL